MTDAPLPAPTMPTPYASPVGSSGRRWLPWAVSLLVAVVLVAGVTTVLVRSLRTGTSPGSTPARAADAYYAALHRQDAHGAFALVCQAQQAEGYAAYAAEVSQDTRTGTGIRTWSRTGAVATQGSEALVSGHLVLDDGSATDIRLLLEDTAGGWRVCTSDLGGILPGPGETSTGGEPT